MKKILFFIFIIFNFYHFISAEINVVASVDKNVVSLNEQITLQITISGTTTNLPQPKIPQLSEFQVYSSGRSQNISIINGQVNSSITFSYVLVPQKIGEFEIPPITVEYQGKTYQTQPIKIKVEKQTSTQQIPTEKNIYKGTKRDLFIETFVDKKKAYVNEQITLTFRFYTKVNLLSQPQYSPPSTTGFLTEDLPPQRNYYTIIDSERYYVTEIKTALFPTTAGKFTIGEATVRCMIEDFDIDDFFSDSFFKRFFSTGKEVVLKSQPIEITVLPLPQPQPQFFYGSVGKYTITTYIEKTKISQNETVFLNIKISGIGNIKSISFPKSTIENILGKNFLVYDPISSLEIKKENYKVIGNKIFKIPITPLVAGKIVIPEIKFIYFNPETAQYETTISKPITLEVLPAEKSNLNIAKNLSKKEYQKIELEDIRYIFETFKAKRIYSKNLLILIQFIPLFSWLSIITYRTYRKNLLKDIKKYRATRAYKKAFEEIKKINFKDKNKFWEKIYEIITEYLADKMNLTKEAICIEEINKFYKNKISSQTYNELIYFWEEINFYRFAPSKVENLNIKEYLNKVISLLKKLEDETKKI
ncbi:MAG: BatD family protein [Endomicrobia bacterium]|nr:BatD family protein [Endomicrobiia bacterium]